MTCNRCNIAPCRCNDGAFVGRQRRKRYPAFMDDLPRPTPRQLAAIRRFGTPFEEHGDRELFDGWIAYAKKLIRDAKPLCTAVTEGDR